MNEAARTQKPGAKLSGSGSVGRSKQRPYALAEAAQCSISRDVPTSDYAAASFTPTVVPATLPARAISPPMSVILGQHGRDLQLRIRASQPWGTQDPGKLYTAGTRCVAPFRSSRLPRRRVTRSYGKARRSWILDGRYARFTEPSHSNRGSGLQDDDASFARCAVAANLASSFFPRFFARPERDLRHGSAPVGRSKQRPYALAEAVQCSVISDVPVSHAVTGCLLLSDPRRIQENCTLLELGVWRRFGRRVKAAGYRMRLNLNE